MTPQQITDRIDALGDDDATDFINVLVIEENADFGWSRHKGRKYYRFSLFGVVGRSAASKVNALRNWSKNLNIGVAA